MYIEQDLRRALDTILDDIKGGSATNDTAELLKQLADKIEPEYKIDLGGIHPANVPALIRQRATWLARGIEALRDLLRTDWSAENTSRFVALTKENERLEAAIDALRLCLLAPERERGLLENNNRVLQRARDAEALLRTHGIAIPEQPVVSPELEGLKLAVSLLSTSETFDSQLNGEEFVALAALSAGNSSQDVMAVIRNAAQRRLIEH